MRGMERRWQVLLLISIGSFMAFLDAPVVSVAFPEIHESFEGSSPTTIAWVLDGYFIAFAAPLAVAGKLADRFGRRKLFVAGLWAFTIASLVCGIAPSAGVEIAGRVAQGIAAAMVVPAGQGLMLAEFPAGERKAAIGILSAVVGLASAIAPGIGGIIVDTMGWRWIFLLNVIVGAAAIAWSLSLLRRDEPARPGAPIPDMAGAALQGAGLALVVLAILKRADWGTVDVRTVAALAIGVAAVALFLRRSARHPAPVLDLELFRNRTFAMANFGGMIFGAGLFGSMIVAVFYFTAIWGFSPLETGLAFLPGALAGAVFGRAAGRASEQHGPRIVAVVGSAIAAVGMLLITLMSGAESNYLSDWLPGQLLYGAGSVIAITGLNAAALTSAPPAAFGLASGINAAMRQVGGAIGVAIAIAITVDAAPADLVSSHHAAFYVSTVFMAAAAVAAMAMHGPGPRPQIEPQEAVQAR